MITQTRTRHIDPDVTVFEISGRLSLGNTLMTVETAITRLIEEGARKLVVDVSNLSAIDSSGIGMLVTVSGHIEQRGGKMRIAGAQGMVAKVLELVHVERLAPIDHDLDSATRRLAAEGAGA